MPGEGFTLTAVGRLGRGGGRGLSQGRLACSGASVAGEHPPSVNNRWLYVLARPSCRSSPVTREARFPACLSCQWCRLMPEQAGLPVEQLACGFRALDGY
jgi:hypothetical protein